jgi:ribosomal protein S27E
MKQSPMVMDPPCIENATASAKRYIESTIKLAEDFKTDPNKSERVAACLCKLCYYRGGGWAGQAFTYRDCMRCHIEQAYSSTNTDVLCKECAQISKLCKHCGGDMETKSRRKFPQPLPKLQPNI